MVLILKYSGLYFININLFNSYLVYLVPFVAISLIRYSQSEIEYV